MLRLAPSIFPDGKQVAERLRDGTLARVGLALGAQAGERRVRDVLSKGGFTVPPFNMILEAWP